MSTVLGLDLGTSSFKVSAYEETGRHLGTLSRPTEWEKAAGVLEMDPNWFSASVRQLVDDCAQAYADGPVAGVGVTGMAETMFVETADGRRLPARAWNTRAGSMPLPDDDLFATTGLLDSARTPAVQLRATTEIGVPVHSWAGLPERAVQMLGGRLVAERSLAARTGLVDVLRGRWSPAMVGWAGLDVETVPVIQPAGKESGRCDLPDRCADAVLTVAGHDHLVAALGAGADGDETAFDSFGTGEALIARIARTPDEVDSVRLAAFNAAGYNVGLGLDESDLVAVRGLSTGNRLNVLLAALAGLGFPPDEVMLAEANAASLVGVGFIHSMPSALTELLSDLFGPDWQNLRDSGTAGTVLRSTVLDLAGARAVWWAAVAVATEVARDSLTSLDVLLPGLGKLVATGGWLRNPGIRRIREDVLGPFEVPDVLQCGTRGAALLAGQACGLFPSRADFPAAPTRAGVNE